MKLDVKLNKRSRFNIYIIAFLVLSLLPLSLSQTTQSLKSYTLGDNVTLQSVCDCSYITYESITDEFSNELITPINLTKSGTTFSLTLSNSTINKTGLHTVTGHGLTTSGETIAFDYKFNIKRNTKGLFGFDYNDTWSLIFLAIIGVLILIFSFSKKEGYAGLMLYIVALIGFYNDLKWYFIVILMLIATALVVRGFSDK